tara:strand:- start:10198 stop:10524 length:327 start_codon:yes stop_codon:yes gene_type:complete
MKKILLSVIAPVLALATGQASAQEDCTTCEVAPQEFKYDDKAAERDNPMVSDIATVKASEIENIKLGDGIKGEVQAMPNIKLGNGIKGEFRAMPNEKLGNGIKGESAD